MEHTIVDNRKFASNYCKLTLDISGDTNVPIPGQFYNIRCSEGNDPLLRRPFSMHRVTKTRGSVHLEILYQVVGKGTEWLSGRHKRENLDILGPFGNGFIIDYEATNVVLVAGGIGIAPLYALGQETRLGNANAMISIVLGARSKTEIFYEKECSEIGKVFVATDDGTYGFRGTANDLLVHLLEHDKLPETCSMYACGPAPMLKELANISEKFGFPGQVALEGHMGCGFGACLSCVCPLKPKCINRDNHWEKPALQCSEDGSLVYSLICKDGPIYDIREVDWDEWLT